MSTGLAQGEFLQLLAQVWVLDWLSSSWHAHCVTNEGEKKARLLSRGWWLMKESKQQVSQLTCQHRSKFGSVSFVREGKPTAGCAEEFWCVGFFFGPQQRFLCSLVNSEIENWRREKKVVQISGGFWSCANSGICFYAEKIFLFFAFGRVLRSHKKWQKTKSCCWKKVCVWKP